MQNFLRYWHVAHLPFALITRKLRRESRIVEDKIKLAKEEGFFEPVSLHPVVDVKLNYFNGEGRKLAVSADDGEPQIINVHGKYSNRLWEKWVSNNIIEVVSTHKIENSGKHTVKPGWWMQVWLFKK